MELGPKREAHLHPPQPQERKTILRRTRSSAPPGSTAAAGKVQRVRNQTARRRRLARQRSSGENSPGQNSMVARGQVKPATFEHGPADLVSGGGLHLPALTLVAAQGDALHAIGGRQQHL